MGGKIVQVGSRLIDMTAKKMADIFFGKFSELISSESVLSEIENKKEEENQQKEKTNIQKKINNKYIFYLSALVLLVIVGYLII